MDTVLKILLVEDDEDDYILTRDLLSEIQTMPHELVWTDQYGEALEHMQNNRHDVYLLDYRIGATDGLELLRQAVVGGCRGPIILLTGQGDRQVDVEAMRAGAMDYLVKGELTASLLERTIRYARERKRIEAELAEMRQRMEDSREEERLQMAQELHDGPLQELIGARFHLGILDPHLEEEQHQEQLQTVQESLREVIQTLRTMCGELRPPALAPFGLEKAIRAHARQFSESNPDIEVQLELDEDKQLLSERVRLALYRIYQQALVNVAKHSGASHVRIIFRLRDNSVRLRVIDDGCGFVPPQNWLELARDGHFGLLGATERAEAIGGKLRIISDPQIGTTVSVTAPLHPHAETAPPQEASVPEP